MRAALLRVTLLGLNMHEEITTGIAGITFISTAAPSMGSRTLPPEIWLHILQIATDAPGAFDADVPEFFSHPAAELAHVDNTSELTMLRASLAVRRMLVRVCHMWNALATPLLYRALWIGCQHALLLLGDTLEQRPELGMHARRLDVAIHGKARVRYPPSAQERMLGRILTHTPRLEVFIASISAQPRWLRLSTWKSTEIFEALGDVCGASLRRLCWVGAPIHADVYRYNKALRAEVASLLRRTPNLCTLIGLVVPMDLDSSLALPKLTFGHFEVHPHLQTEPVRSLTCFPSLQHAHFPYYDYLHFDRQPMRSAITPSPLFTTAYLADLMILFVLTGTPITKLHLSSSEWWLYKTAYPPHLLPATIVYLGISTKAPRTDDGLMFVTFVEWLHACKDAAPGLSVVRLSNDMGSASLARHPEWLGDGIALLAERGVRIENAAGDALQPQPVILRPNRPVEWDPFEDDDWLGHDITLLYERF
ncbi:hypothetical protein BC834DRAFT_543595 [Gloeopeniophorella convolvens]|nr:hypothetical protein BC834DRAFT_543595 [Gloeopeniophorella convolvens]